MNNQTISKQVKERVRALRQIAPDEKQYLKLRIESILRRKSLREVIAILSKQLEEADEVWRTTYQKCKSSQ